MTEHEKQAGAAGGNLTEAPPAPKARMHSRDKGETRLYAVQQARIESLTAARSVLAKTTGGPFAKSNEAVEATDLVSVAGWIMDGTDPWTPKVTEPNLPEVTTETLSDESDDVRHFRLLAERVDRLEGVARRHGLL